MNIKPVLLAIALLPIAASTHANTTAPVVASPTLKVTGGKATNMASFENIVTSGYASEKSGLSNQYDVGATVKLVGAADVTFTFVGKEASYTNAFYVSDVFKFNNQTAIVDSTSVTYKNVKSGTVLDFGFKSQSVGKLYENGSNRIALMTNANDTSVLALFNDTYKGDKDFDDMGVKITLNSVVASVPEPESYAMLLAGLGLIGGMVRRRKGVRQ